MPPTEQPGHIIKLLDSTAPPSELQLPTPEEPESPPDTPQSPTSKDLETALNDNWLVKKGRKRGDTIRKEWNKHKYARYQEGRLVAEDPDATEEDVLSPLPDVDKGKGKASSQQDDNSTIASSKVQKAYSHRTGRILDRLPFRSKIPRRQGEEPNSAVDILYENQRGSFFCGIPLYSSNSLLNFDPAPWQTADFSDSPVNITNAQVPDPTWVWAWRRWYVDMSHDVDEEGWEYSFSFRQGFSWHGSQPWFTSFVRRRRWLRRRMRTGRPERNQQHTMHDAHILNSDYFTIHPSALQAQSRGSSTERKAYEASTIPSAVPQDDEESEEEDDADITNVTELLKRLKRTTIDRKKLDSFRNFLEHGGDELAYLPGRINDIMALFLYQNSRRQVLLELEGALSKARRDSEPVIHDAGKPHEGPQKPGLSLKRAVDAIANQVKELEYYSDIKAVASPLSPTFKGFDAASLRSVAHSHHEEGPLGESLDDEMLDSPTRENSDTGWRIKGIPESAHLGENVGLTARIERARQTQESVRPAEEKAEKAKE